MQHNRWVAIRFIDGPVRLSVAMMPLSNMKQLIPLPTPVRRLLVPVSDEGA